jgi:squalene-hopene/tetraprenyl-beta-curcumene cyclase
MIAVVMVAAALLLGAASRPAEWDCEGAARYLDERMDIWFAKAKKLKTGDGETACVSCHTALPYALSRSALRRAMRVTEPTTQETRVVDGVVRRVETYDAHEPMYDFNDAKKIESRGTEAVLNALILATLNGPEDATRKAFRRLWSTQRADGAWDWLDFGLEPFETADAVYYGAALAALAAGTARADVAAEPDARAAIDKLRRYLTENYAAQRLFNRTWLLVSSSRFKDALTRGQRDALVADLERSQREDGGWSLESLAAWRWSKPAAPFRPPGTTDASLLAQCDGYATGLVVYALEQAGRSPRQPSVAKGLHWLRTHQAGVPVGSATPAAWRTHSLNFDREHGGEKGEPWRRLFMSDSATGFAVLALTGSK